MKVYREATPEQIRAWRKIQAWVNAGFLTLLIAGSVLVIVAIFTIPLWGG